MKTSFLLFATFYGLVLSAQPISPRVSANYPASVVVQLYNVASKIPLDEAKQNSLATHFAFTDSIMALDIKNGATALEMQLEKYKSHEKFNKILGDSLIDKYYTAMVLPSVGMEALQATTVTVDLHRGDSAMRKILFPIYYKQALALAKIQLQYEDRPELGNSIYNLLYTKDTLLENYLHWVRGNIFYNEKLAQINKVKPLDNKQALRLRDSYTNLCIKKNGTSYADDFNEAMRRVIKDTSYYSALYATEIGQRATANAGWKFFHIFNDNKMTSQGADAVRAALYAKERNLALLDIAFPTFTKYKDSLQQRMLRPADSLITVALMKDGVFPFATQFSAAIKMRQRLVLRQGQVDTLMGHAVTVMQMKEDFIKKYPLGSFEASAYEAQHLPTVLSDDQYRLVLGEKNRAQADKWAAEDWAEIKKRGLADGSDSAYTVYQLATYNTNRLVAKDYYANDKIMQNAMINDIDNNMPALMRKLKVARRADTVANATKEQPVKNTFKW